MLSFLNPGGEIFLANLSRIEQSNEKTQREISSGLKISQPEDAPDQITQLLQLQASLSQNTQIQTNLTQMQTAAQTADQAISSILQLADQAASLGAQGASSTVAAGVRQNLAQQVQTILQQVVSTSQTSISGRYLFSGDTDRAPAYVYDAASPTGVDRLSTAANTLLAVDPNGNTFPSGLTAGQLFDHRNPDDSIAPDNLFAALNSLYVSLSSNNTAGIASSIASLQQSSTYISQQQGFYGALENRLTGALDTANTLTISLNQQIADLRGTDLSQAAVDLTTGQTQLQAALSAQSKAPRTSLFDFLG